ncbi:hypothetical protein VFPFJ_11471 [Purpureocillium lilacinum]|uniref:Uncharacterized protein n=1 Tax=Purpureocillium lilacinum TaxID=33203 RepID=A0A179F7A4_PURLI|nr:hypothetical protein VFPFJ_11471 [Purpureocillium lilacinum]OAQ61308.1 hypothetical protein VFPFJ_11471 [Purpureocillium lilacinum]
MVTPLRSRLDADIIGMCQVLRSWLRAGVIDDLDVLLLPVANLGAEDEADHIPWMTRFEETGADDREWE